MKIMYFIIIMLQIIECFGWFRTPSCHLSMLDCALPLIKPPHFSGSSQLDCLMQHQAVVYVYLCVCVYVERVNWRVHESYDAFQLRHFLVSTMHKGKFTVAEVNVLNMWYNPSWLVCNFLHLFLQQKSAFITSHKSFTQEDYPSKAELKLMQKRWKLQSRKHY